MNRGPIGQGSARLSRKHPLIPLALRPGGVATAAWLLSLCAGLSGGLATATGFGADGNLIANGDFREKDPEQRPLRWVEGKGPQTATVTRKEHHSAEKDDSSLELAVRTGQEVLVRTEKQIANPGTLYVAKA